MSKAADVASIPGGRIVVAEALIGDIGTPGLAPLMDMTMMVVLGGKERSLEEYKALFFAANLRFHSCDVDVDPMLAA